jgi:hypothetical protein
MRRLIILPMTKCGSRCRRTGREEAEQEGRALDHQQGARRTANEAEEIIAYLPRLMSLPVCSSRLRSSAGLGSGSRRSPSTGSRAGHQLADLRLGVGGEHVAVALLDQLDAALERLATPTGRSSP